MNRKNWQSFKKTLYSTNTRLRKVEQADDTINYELERERLLMQRC